jgi:beta-barrel assembly-enhancing protease
VKTLLRFLSAATLVLVLASCSSLLGGLSPGNIMGTVIGAASGDTQDQANLNQLQKAGEAVGSAAQDITPEQEYYIGRAVAATVLQTYKPWDSAGANTYLNTLGRALSLASVEPETFSGYHFLAMDSDDINAFGAPSGFVLVSRGLLRLATSEDEVAAILAHEIGHVSLKHGLKAISSGRWAEAFKQIGLFAAANSGNAALQDLTNSFGDVIGDIAKTMITSGYSRELEMNADIEAVRILHDVGYDPAALIRVMKAMESKLKPGGKDFAKTHPDPETRIAYLNEAVKALPPMASATAAQAAARKARWQSALGKA